MTVRVISSIQDGNFRGCSPIEGVGAKRPTIPKICHTYPVMMKLCSYTLPKEDTRDIWITWHPLTSAGISIFSSVIRKLCYIKKYRYRLHFSVQFLILLAFRKCLKICLINLVIILMMSAKISTTDLLKITLFWNTGFDINMTSPTKIYHVI